jgi:uncharacterized protein (TIGR02996 family)
VSDRAALLAAICAHPDEDTPRLVYADWLDEHGQGKRAAHIRAQIEHHRLRSADTPAAAIDEFLDARHEHADRIDWGGTVDTELGACAAARRAMEKQSFELTMESEDVPRDTSGRFESTGRGFFDSVSVYSADDLLRHAAAIFRAAPVTTVHFGHLHEGQVAEFAAAGHLARLRGLILTEEAMPEAVRALGNHPGAAGIRRLNLNIEDQTEWRAEVVAAVAVGKHWTGLKRLDLTALAFDADNALADLFARPQFRGLREIRAKDSPVGAAAVRAIAAHLSELRVLSVADGTVTGEGLGALAAAKALRNLRYLELVQTLSQEPEAADPVALINSPNLPNLCALRLACNYSRPDPKVLARAGRGPGLRALDLWGSHFSAAAVEALAACPALRGLWYLSLGSTRLRDVNLERLTRRAAIERLTVLDLGHNDLTARGLKALAAWPGAANLQWLDVSGNSIGEPGARALAASPHLKGLKYLHASGRGSAILKKHFKRAFV